MRRVFNKEISVIVILLVKLLNLNERVQLKSRTLNSPIMQAKNTITLVFTLPIQFVS